MSPEAGEKPARRGEFKRKARCQDPSSRKRLSFFCSVVFTSARVQTFIAPGSSVHDRSCFWLPLPPVTLRHYFWLWPPCGWLTHVADLMLICRSRMINTVFPTTSLGSCVHAVNIMPSTTHSIVRATLVSRALVSLRIRPGVLQLYDIQ